MRPTRPRGPIGRGNRLKIGVLWVRVPPGVQTSGVIDEAVAAYGSVRGVGVRRVLRALDVERVSVGADVCRDIDTPEDVAWWETFLSN